MSSNLRYCYHPQTGEFVGAASCALSPARPFVDGQPNYIVPANSTDVAPPNADAGHKPVWNGSAWTLTEDHRGSLVYSTADGSAKNVTSLGQVPAGYTAKAIPSALHSWNGADWALDHDKAETDARAQRNARLTACDWTQLPDAPLAPGLKAKWADYRQALRDYMDPWTPGKTWPALPGVN